MKKTFGKVGKFCMLMGGWWCVSIHTGQNPSSHTLQVGASAYADLDTSIKLIFKKSGVIYNRLTSCGVCVCVQE